MNEENSHKKIDVEAIYKKLKPHKKKYYYVLSATLIASYLLMLCIPRYYSCKVSLAPETNSASLSGSLGSLSSLASSVGLGSLSKMAGQDAISSELYPEVLESNDFIADLLTTEVTTLENDIKCNYYVYRRDHQKAPWWTMMMGTVKSWFATHEPDSYNGEERLSTFEMTQSQSDLVESVKRSIKCMEDKKTGVITITVKDQDPRVCALVANAACEKLQAFIIEYRTHKAQVDCDYYQNLCKESKEAYEKARITYASYADSHQDAYMISSRSKIEELENDVQQKYNIYSTMNAQLQAATAKLQEMTPAFTVIQKASIPTRPAGPKRVFTAVFFTFVAFFVLSGWLLIKK